MGAGHRPAELAKWIILFGRYKSIEFAKLQFYLFIYLVDANMADIFGLQMFYEFVKIKTLVNKQCFTKICDLSTSKNNQAEKESLGA